MKNTKIICTIGPASDNYNTLKKMAEAGMNVARINMSHGSMESAQAKVDLIKKLREDMKTPLAILIDTKGPEVRIKNFENGSVNIKKGSTFTFTTADVIGNETKVSVNYPNLHKDMKKDSIILLNDGLLKFVVKEVKGKNIACKCVEGGVLSDKKGMHFPKTHLKMNFLSEADKKDLDFAVKNDVEFIAASFVSNAKDVLELKTYLKSKGLTDINIISKIESHSGVDNIDEIIEASEGIMIARGDMGVEIDYYKLPKIQKSIIRKVKSVGKQVVVATEMLESMINNSRPTRAEISDVANAVYDEACAIMLSGETAVGKNPVKVVKVMSEIACHTEENIKYDKRFKNTLSKKQTVTDVISHSACNTAIELDAKAIIISTESGKTARMVSKFRPNVPIITFVLNPKVYYQLALSWGVYSINAPNANNIGELLDNSQKEVKKLKGIKKGDLFVVTAGVPLGEKGSTNLIQVEQVK